MKKLEEICSWKKYADKNPDCEFYCLKCDGKYEEDCGCYFTGKTGFEEGEELR